MGRSLAVLALPALSCTTQVLLLEQVVVGDYGVDLEDSTATGTETTRFVGVNDFEGEVVCAMERQAAGVDSELSCPDCSFALDLSYEPATVAVDLELGRGETGCSILGLDAAEGAPAERTGLGHAPAFEGEEEVLLAWLEEDGQWVTLAPSELDPGGAWTWTWEPGTTVSVAW